MYLQLLELCLFVPYFSPWLMLILQFNGLLVYIFKVDLIFFFLKICFKALPGLSSSDRNVRTSLFLTHTRNECSLTRGCCKVLGMCCCCFLLAGSSQSVIWTQQHVWTRFMEQFGTANWVFFSPFYKHNCCHRAKVTFASSCLVSSNKEPRGHGRRKVKLMMGF